VGPEGVDILDVTEGMLTRSGRLPNTSACVQHCDTCHAEYQDAVERPFLSWAAVWARRVWPRVQLGLKLRALRAPRRLRMVLCARQGELKQAWIMRESGKVAVIGNGSDEKTAVMAEGVNAGGIGEGVQR